MTLEQQQLSDNASVKWLITHGKTLSPLGEKVAYILGEVFDGIYHEDRAVLHRRVEWNDDRHIQVVCGQLYKLSIEKLVKLSSNCNVGFSLDGASSRYLRIRFWHKGN